MAIKRRDERGNIIGEETGPDLVERHNSGNELNDTMYKLSGAKDNTPDYLKYEMDEDNHLPWQRYLSGEVAGGILDRNTSQQDAADLSRGLDQPADLWGEAETPMAAAISQKYKNQVGNKLESVKSGFEVEDKASDQLRRASTMMGQRERIRMQNFKEQYEFQEKRRQLYQQWKNAQDQATAGWIGSVLGLVGTGIGLALGGPVGAIAGASAGQTAGAGVGGIAGAGG